LWCTRSTLAYRTNLDDASSSQKRSRRKTHSKIRFADLARTIVNRWKKQDGASKAIFENCAAFEKVWYQ
jgi:hypothetical protein